MIKKNKTFLTYHNLCFSDPTNSKYFHPSEVNFDKNMHVFIECIETSAKTSNADGIAAIKVTSLLRPQLLLKFSQVIKETRKSNNHE